MKQRSSTSSQASTDREAIEVTVERLPFKTRNPATFEQWLADGDYNRVSPFITAERYGCVGTLSSDAELVLVSFSDSMPNYRVPECFAQHDLVQGTILDLLILGAQFPEKQRESILVATGSVVKTQSSEYVPFLMTDRSGRRLMEHAANGSWGRGVKLVARLSGV